MEDKWLIENLIVVKSYSHMRAGLKLGHRNTVKHG